MLQNPVFSKAFIPIKKPLLNAVCYACDQAATSWEHAPPECFFPDEFRSNLLEVPSCEKHNQSKSSDDEYTACFLAMNSEGSEAAQRLFQGKRLRSMLRREGRLGRRIFSRSAPAINDEGQETLAIHYEIDRINKVMEHIARALYFDHTNKKWFQGCEVHCPRVYQDSRKLGKVLAQLKDVSSAFEALRKTGHPSGLIHASHPTIFWWQLMEPEPDIQHIRMMFYDTFEFFVFTRKNLAEENIRHA